MSFDVYERPDLPRDAPIFVFIHGGYWQESSKGGNTFLVQPLVSAGVRVFLLGYDLCPKITLSALYDEILVGLSKILLLAQEEYSEAAVTLSGHSAGACLALSMLTEERWRQLPNSHLIRSVFLLGGIYDLSEAQHTEVVNKDNLLALTEENVRELSPLQQSFGHLAEEGTSVRISVVVAEFDAPGLVEQGHQLMDKLRGEGVASEFVEAQGFDHFDLVTELRSEECFLIQRITSECFSSSASSSSVN